MKTKSKFQIIAALLLLAVTTSMSTDSCVRQLYAGPLGKWGTPLTLMNCFGEKLGCKFSAKETPIEGPIRFQVSLNNGAWQEYSEDDFVHGQDIKARASSSTTGGYVKILAQCSCPCN